LCGCEAFLRVIFCDKSIQSRANMSRSTGVLGGDLRRTISCVEECKNVSITGNVWTTQLKCPKDFKKVETHAKVCPAFKSAYESIKDHPWCVYTKGKRRRNGLGPNQEGWTERKRQIKVPGSMVPFVVPQNVAYEEITLDQLMLNVDSTFLRWLMDHHVIDKLKLIPADMDCKLFFLRQLYQQFVDVGPEAVPMDVNQSFAYFADFFHSDDSESEVESAGASPSPKRTRAEPMTARASAPAVKVITHDDFVAGIAAMEERMGTTEEHLKAILALLKEGKK